MSDGLWLVIFAKDGGDSAAETAVHNVQRAIALDTMRLFREVVPNGKIALCASDAHLARHFDGAADKVSVDRGPFHFGARLQALVEELRPAGVLYAGVGSTPFLDATLLRGIAARLREGPAIVANNLFSSDFVGWAPAGALLTVPPPLTDNDLAWTLARRTALPVHVLDRCLATQFDVDTPTDVAILKRLSARTGEATRLTLEACGVDLPGLAAVENVLRNPVATAFLAGRINPQNWRYFERATNCQTRVLSEERGMRASGRGAKGEVSSLIGSYLQSVGPEGFFSNFARMADALLMDSRVVFAHLGLTLSTADRFHSDLLQADMIADPVVAAFTLAARDATIPVILGGHGLVSGGLLALAEVAKGS